MDEAYVQLICPACEKDWTAAPHELPAPDDSYSCPSCGEEERLARFARTETDLDALRTL